MDELLVFGLFVSKNSKIKKKKQQILNNGKERKHAILYTTTCTVLS